MRIVLYSQQPRPGGSLRLLLNLARYLAARHEVLLTLDQIGLADQLPLLAMYPEVRVSPAQQVAQSNQAFDAAVLHLPFTDQAPAFARPGRQIAVALELTARHPPTVTPANAARFAAVGYLHPDQVGPLADTPFAARCVLLPVIDNIDFAPSPTLTGRVATIGFNQKTGLAELLRVIHRTRRRFALDVYTNGRLRRADGWCNTLRLAWYLRTGRLVNCGTQYHARTLMDSFDCLLHLPDLGNGTSTVVSDALHCGKTVVLSNLPDYRRAYGRLQGVHFIDDLDYDLTPVLSEYSLAQQQEIRDGYLQTYDRAAGLRQWEALITGSPVSV